MVKRLYGTKFCATARWRGAWCSVGLALWCVLALAVEIEVGIDPNPPISGESFRLAFVVTGEIDGEPDFTPLENQFEVLSRNRQTSIAWVNGTHTRTSTWVVEVLAKAAGPLEIPAITFGDTRSAPLKVPITGNAKATPTDDGLFLEIDAVPRDPYIQQQVTYTIRLWRRYELSNASLSEPHLSSDAIVRPLGEDRQFEAERNGKRYEIIERSFALFPQASGKHTIEPVTVTAQVLERVTSLFEMFGRSVKTRRISSEAIELNVRPVPAEFPPNAAWLPARKVRLNEDWEPADLRAKVGDPVTRTVSLWVSGLTSGQLPEMLPPAVPGLKAYPDQPQLKEDKQDGVITAVRQEKVALIPAGGEHELPALDIPWWNTDTNTLEHARLPSRILSAIADPAPAELPVAAIPSALLPNAEQAPPSSLMTPATPDWRAWRGWFAVALCALIGWPVSLIWILRYARGRVSPAIPLEHAREVPRLRVAREAVLNSCRRHDPLATRAALLTWASARWSRAAPITLGALAALVEPPLAAPILALDAALYGRSGLSWQGETLAAAFTAHARFAPARTPSPDTLPKIFRLAG